MLYITLREKNVNKLSYTVKNPGERAKADSAHAHRGLHRGYPAEGCQAGRCHQGNKKQRGI